MALFSGRRERIVRTPGAGINEESIRASVHTLPKVAHAHHAALLPIVDGIVALAEELEAPSPDFRSRLAEEYRLITGQLIPHMEQAEATLYPELERLMQNRHSMTPMRHEHRELRGLIDELGRLTNQELWFGARLRLRRVLYRMYAILKIHLAEEQAYVDVLDLNLSDEEQAELASAMDHAMAGAPDRPTRTRLSSADGRPPPSRGIVARAGRHDRVRSPR